MTQSKSLLVYALAFAHPTPRYLCQAMKPQHRLLMFAALIVFGLAGFETQAQSSTGVSFNECPIFVPNAFTPNGDSKNDFWGAEANPDCTPVKYNMRVYDRWGRLVYHTESPSSEYFWDGKVDGTELRAGVYMWQMDAVYTIPAGNNNVEIQRKGTVVLIR